MLLSAALATQAAAQDTRRLLLADDFEDGNFSPAGGLYYKDNAEQRAGSVLFQSRIVRQGRAALELSVRSQCGVTNDECSERAEIWERPSVLVPYDQPVWYAFSMRLAEPVPSAVHRYVMAQWKREIAPGADGDYSPFLALRMTGGKIFFTVDTDEVPTFPLGGADRPNGCRPGEAHVTAQTGVGQTRAIVAMEAGAVPADYGSYTSCTPSITVTPRGVLPAAGSGWIDFVVMVHPGPRGGGRIELGANGSWVATITGNIGHAGPGLGVNQSFKFGPYRAGRPEPWTVFYDRFRRGPSCTDVTTAANCPP
jgi:hypothetical protein